jgi:hypothetical protein
MWEISIWFFVFLFAINGFLVYFADAVTDYDLISPFTNSTYTPPTLPNVNNTFGNLTASSAYNATTGAPASVSIWDTAIYAWNATVFFIQFLVGSISGAFFVTLGMPAAFLTILYGVEILFVGITVLHFWRGLF